MSFVRRHLSIALALTMVSGAGSAIATSGTAMLANRIRGHIAGGTGIVPLDRRFFHGNSFIEGTPWLMLFCGGHDVQQCADTRRELKRLSEMKQSPVGSFHFAEVDCTQDEPFCQEQGFAEQPVVVAHFFEGYRQAVWSPLRQREIAPAKDFAKWIRETIEGDWPYDSIWAQVSGTWQSAWHQLLRMAPSIVDPEIIFPVACMILIEVAVVSWVVMEGFEVWPKFFKAR